MIVAGSSTHRDGLSARRARLDEHVARRRLLGAAGIDAAVDPAALDEAEIRRAFRAEGSDALACAAALAEGKALKVSRRHPGALVIGADQILDCDGVWFEKPADIGAARDHLWALRGKRHMLATAVAVAVDGRVVCSRRHHSPRLTMRRFSDAFLEEYLATAGEAVLSSVGAYQLEGPGVQLFAAVDGDYFSILGLPLLPLLAFLRDRGAVASMKILGLTGSVGMGKSTAAAMRLPLARAGP